jgi:hypothetical protein
MRQGRSLGKRTSFTAAVAFLLAAGTALGQTPIPTLPPLPPLPASTDATTPAAQPAATPAPAADLGATQAAAPTPAPTSAPATSTAAPATAPAERPAASEAPGGLPPTVLVLLGIGVLVLVATLVVVLTVLLKKPVVITVPSRSAAPPPTPAPSADAPLDALPGRFVVDEDDRPTEIRIFRTYPGERVETTIGRDPGPPYRHIQLLSPSVAGKHAKLVFDRGNYSLINYARANPSRVNGEELEENASRRLVDNDRIEIGDVVLVYRED